MKHSHLDSGADYDRDPNAMLPHEESLNVGLTMSKALGGSGEPSKTNPEELFAAGFGGKIRIRIAFPPPPLPPSLFLE